MKARLKRLLDSRFRLSAQFFLGITGAVLPTLAASVVAWLSLGHVAEVQRQVTEGSVPEMAASFEVAQYAGNLVAASPGLVTAPTAEQLERVATQIAGAHRAFENELALLQRADADSASIERVRARADALVSNIETIRRGMTELFPLTARSAAQRSELTELQSRLEALVAPALDDQFFYTVTGYRTLAAPPAPRAEHLSERELGRYRLLADLDASIGIAFQVLADAFRVSDASALEPLRERFESAVGRVERALATLEASPLRAALAPAVARLSVLGFDEQSGFALRSRELRIAAEQRDLLARNRDLAVELIVVVDELVSSARTRTRDAALTSTGAIQTARSLLLVISAISIGGAGVVAWLFVGRVLLRRLAMLSNSMRRMAGGDLEVPVEVGGRDEIAEMAAALEVFRRHSREAEWLKAMEALTDAVQEKNEELQAALEKLRQAQEQIVMREKLAALGELTAGVAHEIRNPLNFVKNFSESSGELIVELREVLDKQGGKLDEEQRELVGEITGDLLDNLERIRSHGDRANRIVHGMLELGRGSADMQQTDLNALLQEYARLAFQSARMANPDSPVDLQFDLDPAVGELEVVPQDLGRVFLNMVSNACDATEAKRQAMAAEEEPYAPALRIGSKRCAETIEIRIKDNGEGIPPEIVDKIFVPFFTTKPAGKGTGLGLALSGDIVREHGGTVRVETEPGAFTEMILELPVALPATVGATPAPSDGGRLPVPRPQHGGRDEDTSRT